MNENPIIIDGRRIINPHKAEKLGFTYYGVEFGKIKHKEDHKIDFHVHLNLST